VVTPFTPYYLWYKKQSNVSIAAKSKDMKRYCLKCKKAFEPVRKNHVFCSSKCRAESWKINHYWKDFDPTDNGNHIPVQQKITFARVEQGVLFKTLKKVKLVEQLWIFAHSILWGAQNFSEEEQDRFKKYLSEYFPDGANVEETFRELVERFVLAKRYLLEKPYRFIAPPNDYLNPKFYNSFSSTATWFRALQVLKQKNPDICESLEVFSEAILNYATTQNILDIVFYRHVFTSLENYDLLQWYMNAIVHYQFLHY
jgi:hypothetical protein